MTSQQKNARLLLVEDNPADVLLLQQALEHGAGLAVLDVAETGEDALALLRDEARPLPDLVLLDLNLPSMNGDEVLQRLRRSGRTRHLPVIILTTSQAPGDIRRAYDHSASSYVVKPLDFPSFQEAVASLEHFWLETAELPEGSESKPEPGGPLDAERRSASVTPLAPRIAKPEPPAASPVRSGSTGEVASPAAVERLRVLVVEDNPGDVLLLKLAFEEDSAHEYVLVICESLAEASSAFDREDFDLVVLDLSLPDSVGLLTLVQIRARSGNVPIVVLSGQEDEVLAAAALQRGAQDYVIKGQASAREMHRIVRHARERARGEADLRRAQQVETTGRLAGGIAHEFNNALQVIRSSLDVIGEVREADGDLATALAAIGTACDRGMALTRQLLSVGRQPLTVVEPLMLDAIVGRTEPIVRRLLGEAFRVEYDLRCPDACIRADAAQMEQLVLNLAINAMDAMGARGSFRVTSRVERSRLGLSAGAERVPVAVVEVADDGCGMTADVRARCMEPFYTTKSAERGSGLGLSTVFAVVRGLGGEVEIDSAPDAGTRFRLLLPFSDPPQDLERSAKAGTEAVDPAVPAAASAGRAHVGQAPRRVLVVEDNDGIRMLLQTMLRLAGFDPVVAADGQEALDVYRAEADAIRLVVTDMQLPGINGDALHRELRRLGFDGGTLFMSGYGADRLDPLGDGFGIHAFLAKPFDRKGLLAAIEQLSARVSAD